MQQGNTSARTEQLLYHSLGTPYTFATVKQASEPVPTVPLDEAAGLF